MNKISVLTFLLLSSLLVLLLSGCRAGCIEQENLEAENSQADVLDVRNGAVIVEDETGPEESTLQHVLNLGVSRVRADTGNTVVLLENGEVWAWGHVGQGGKFCNWCPRRYPRLLAYPMKIIDEVSYISVGSCIMAIRADGSLWVLEENIGIDAEGDLFNPVKVMDDVISISDGSANTMVIKADGSLWGWGSSIWGQLIGGTVIDRHNPVRIMEDVISVSNGGDVTFAIRTDGSLWGWGNNSSGQLGDGTIINRYSPIKIMSDVISVYTSSIHTFAIRSDRSLWAWGNNEHGQLGDGTTINRYSPVKIMYDVISLSGGFRHTAAMRTDGSLWTWGRSYTGQLGCCIGIGYSRGNPVKIMYDVVAVSTGLGHTLAIRTDGSLWGWGSNIWGQVGNGRDNFSPDMGDLMFDVINNTIGEEFIQFVPVEIMSNVAYVSAGMSHSLAVTYDNRIWAWGDNHAGQLGDGTIINSSTPRKVTVLDWLFPN